MAVIDIGAGATDRAATYSNAGYTLIDLNNTANETGTLDTFEIFANLSDLLNVKIGTFSGSGTTYNDRDYESIGTVTNGSKQTFTGKNCDVSTGDCLGIFWDTQGRIERDTSGYGGVCYVSGDKFGWISTSYSSYSDDAISIYATGATAAAGNPYYYYLQQ
jgi:hypothetical protein